MSDKPEITENQLLVMQKIFFEPEHCDLTIVCGNDRYPVRKSVVLHQSIVSNTRHSLHYQKASPDQTKPEIDLGHEDSDCVKLLIQYLYQGTYHGAAEWPRHKSTNGEPAKYPILVHIHAKMYLMGGRLAMARLQKVASRCIRDLIRPGTVADGEDLALAARAMYSARREGKNGIWRMMIQILARHKCWVTVAKEKQILQEYPSICVEVLEHIASQEEMRAGDEDSLQQEAGMFLPRKRKRTSAESEDE